MHGAVQLAVERRTTRTSANSPPAPGDDGTQLLSRSQRPWTTTHVSTALDELLFVCEVLMEDCLASTIKSVSRRFLSPFLFFPYKNLLCFHVVVYTRNGRVHVAAGALYRCTFDFLISVCLWCGAHISIFSPTFPVRRKWEGRETTRIFPLISVATVNGWRKECSRRSQGMIIDNSLPLP